MTDFSSAAYDGSDILIWMGTVQSAKEFLRHKATEASVTVDQIRAYSESYEEEEDKRFGKYSDLVQVEGRTAIIPVAGSMSSRETWFTRVFGIMTYETIANVSAMIAADDGIDNVFFDIDSPGGMAKGVEVASDAIKMLQESGKETYAHTSGHMMSAAYWIGSAAKTVQASRHAELGSVGVIAVHADFSEMHKEFGVKFTVLRKGEEKALATPFEKLSDEARAQIDRSMERSYSAFIDTVAENRGMPSAMVREQVATGREFGSYEALQLGLIDEVISFNESVSKIESTGSEPTGSNDWSKAAMSKKPILNANAGTMSAEDAATAVAAGLDVNELEAPGNLSAESEEIRAESEEESAEEVQAGSEEQEQPEAKAKSEEQEKKGSDDGLAKLLSDLNGQLVQAKVELASLNSKMAESAAALAGFRTIVIEQTQRMRVALNQSSATEDLEKMTDQALVTAHNQVRESFINRYPVGARSQQPQKEPELPSNVVTRLDTAVMKATQLR
jgi:signal peptide peptidase SppA